jgi:hypothetical protein
VSDFLEILNPGLRYWREERDFQKAKFVEACAPGPGPVTVDLDAGTIVFHADGSPPSASDGCAEGLDGA